MSDQPIGVVESVDDSGYCTVRIGSGDPIKYQWRISMDNVRWVIPCRHGFMLPACEDPDCIVEHIHNE